MTTVKTDAQRLMSNLWWGMATILVVLGGIVAKESWWATILMVLTGLVIFPPVYNHILDKVKLSDRFNLRIPLVFLALVGATTLLFTQDALVKAREQAAIAKEERERLARDQADRMAREAQRKAEVQAEFAKNGDSILAELQKAIDSKNVPAALSIKNRFQPAVNDPRLNALVVKYEEMKQQVDREQAIAVLLKQANTLKVDQYAEAIDIYSKLAGLDPANAQYKSKVDKYTSLKTKADERKRKAAAEAAAKAEREKRIEEQFSGWDGSHRNFERMIKNAMNDPDSYEHVETRYRDMGKTIRVYCTFRGKNAFGGIVKNTKVADFDLDGNFVREIQ